MSAYEPGMPRTACVQYLLQDGFDLFALALAMDPLRQANRLTGNNAFSLKLLSVDGAPVRSSLGISVNADASLKSCAPADLLIICNRSGCWPGRDSDSSDTREALLALIGRHQGLALADALRAILDLTRPRDEAPPAEPPHPGLQRAIALMRTHLAQPIELPRLAADLGLSRRQVERLFQRYLHCTPARYYQRLRLAHARQLLRHSPRPLADVASACGFPCRRHFARCYREHFGRPPQQERQQALEQSTALH
jgi:transcriptional regulator GlxA family with amidase domain